jgi:hypothetical protein
MLAMNPVVALWMKRRGSRRCASHPARGGRDNEDANPDPGDARLAYGAEAGLYIPFFLEGLMSGFRLGYLRTFCPKKSKPFLTCVMAVFARGSSRPRFCRNCSTRR